MRRLVRQPALAVVEDNLEAAGALLIDDTEEDIDTDDDDNDEDEANAELDTAPDRTDTDGP
jgi:hypothetical protein